MKPSKPAKKNVRSFPLYTFGMRHRTADGGAEIVLPVHRGGGENRAPGIQLIVAEEMKHVSVQAVRAALGYKRDQRARCMTVLRVKRVRNHLELGNAVRPRTFEVEVAGVIRRAQAVDDVLHSVRRASPDLEIIKRISVRSRRQERKRQDIPAGIGLPQAEAPGSMSEATCCEISAESCRS